VREILSYLLGRRCFLPSVTEVYDMGVVEKTIVNGSHLQILELTVETLEYWNVSASSICRILCLGVHELAGGHSKADGIDDSCVLTTEQLERSRLVLELRIIINATFENPANRRRFIHMAIPLFSRRTFLDMLENDGTNALRKAVSQLGAQSRWIW